MNSIKNIQQYAIELGTRRDLIIMETLLEVRVENDPVLQIVINYIRDLKNQSQIRLNEFELKHRNDKLELELRSDKLELRGDK